MYRKKSWGNLVLLALEKITDGTVRLNDFINNPGSYVYSGREEYPLKKSEFSRVLKRLRENGLVDFVDDDQLILRLTDQGREKALLAKMLLEDNDWDGRWRIVIFDIPEKRRGVRDFLRNKLKTWGFTPWQQSVWVCKKNCTKPLRDFIKSVGVKDWVMVIESDNVDL